MRADIQALRALAVLLVLLWHAGFAGLSGGYVGVDVFLVVSGFLMTQILLAEIAEQGRLDLPRFYLRRARRLLPAAGATVLGVALLTLTLLPITRWREVAGDIAASAVYVVNWRLAERSVDYLAADAPPSPMQHFWSLAVEEQFYLLWPVLLGLAVMTAVRRGRGSAAGRAAALALVVGALSLAWSAWLSQVDPGRAYFVTTTRVWELALGAALGALWPRWAAARPGPRLATALVLTGLAAILLSAVVLDTATAFPGTAALTPTLGAVAVLLGGPFVRPAGVVHGALALRPVQWLGDISYSLYLWHWPLLVAAAAVVGSDPLPWGTGALVLALTLPVAWLSYRYVEMPFRGRLSPAPLRESARRLARWVLGYALACVAGVGAVLVALATLAPGGLLSTAPPQAQQIRPAPEVARQDVYTPFYDGCDPLPGARLATVCVGGDTTSDTRVVLLGDSHAVMWMPALAAAGERRGWRVELMARPSCPVADVIPMLGDDPKEDCSPWLAEVTEAVTQDPPAAVVTAQVPIPRLWVEGEVVRSADGHELMAQGLARAWDGLRAAGVPVATIGPTPRFEDDPPTCVAEHLEDLGACGQALTSALAPTAPPVRMALDQAPQVELVDLVDELCPQGWCPAVQGSTLVWTDDNHLSRTRSRELAGPLGKALAEVLPDRR
ncbi:acyltransferase family protein [Serinicoccus profundi]|uniref:acyltransferase family protein n=1 Tax=Serinicoccus profundi TaxID=1078471 RepID=UPI000255F4ED|nr:acyltransferase family protein [Serinicoccus profundi]